MELNCVCKRLSLRGLLSYAQRHDITSAEELMAATGAGTECGCCKPYLEQMLRTGRVPTDADLIEPEEEPDITPQEALRRLRGR